MKMYPFVKILHVIPSMDPTQGGLCQALRSIIAGLKNHDIHNEVVSLDNTGNHFFAADDFTVHALGKGKGPWSYNKRLLPWFVANLGYFDVVIIHGLWRYPGYALRKAFSKLRKNAATMLLPKLLIMPHGMLDPYFQKAKNRRLKAVRNVFYWKLVESELFHIADGLLFTCQAEASLASTTFTPYYPIREFIVGLGVDAPPIFTERMKTAFYERCGCSFEDVPYLLFLSRIDEKKGVDLLVKAYADRLKDVDNQDNTRPALPKLVIAGPGLDSPYGRKIQRLAAKDSRLHHAVIFPGMLLDDAKWGAFYGCEAFILPSHQENFGIAVVEALACGKPVLIADQVNIWREIQRAGAGYVSENTLEGTIQLLKSWEQTDATQRETLHRNAKAIYKKTFSPEPATKRLLHAISETLL